MYERKTEEKFDRTPGTSRSGQIAATIATCVLLIVGSSLPAAAATLCVNPGGKGGCFSSIGAAVTAANSGDVINVAHGTYKEDVGISKSLSLIGGDGDDDGPIIDATGQLNGITINKASDVVVSGFIVENAETAGIWITNSSFITISRNTVQYNDKGVVPGTPDTCPSLKGTPFASGENLDCGEGVFLSAVDHSILANNTITRNAGGILMTDDTGASHDNLITGNSVVRNTELDCGITIPSHSGAGVFHNTVSGNDSSYNGGPGVGIFAPGPGSKAYANVIVNNTLRGNGLPGVTMHNHAAPGVGNVPPGAPQPNFNDNVILGNDISDNAKDTADAATGGPTGINIYSVGTMTGTIISQNVIRQESFDIVIKIPAAAVPAVQIHLNNITGNTDVGLMNAGAAQVDATVNWWGCPGGPASKGCASITGTGSVLFTPWLTRPFQAGGDR